MNEISLYQSNVSGGYYFNRDSAGDCTEHIFFRLYPGERVVPMEPSRDMVQSYLDAHNLQRTPVNEAQAREVWLSFLKASPNLRRRDDGIASAPLSPRLEEEKFFAWKYPDGSWCAACRRCLAAGYKQSAEACKERHLMDLVQGGAATLMSPVVQIKLNEVTVTIPNQPTKFRELVFWAFSSTDASAYEGRFQNPDGTFGALMPGSEVELVDGSVVLISKAVPL